MRYSEAYKSVVIYAPPPAEIGGIELSRVSSIIQFVPLAEPCSVQSIGASMNEVSGAAHNLYRVTTRVDL